MQISFQTGPLTEGMRSHLRDLAYGDFRDRWDALKRLVACGDVVVGPLLEMLQDEELDWEARWFAARGLSAFDRPEVVNALLQLLAEAELEELRQAAAEALSQIGATAVVALSSQLNSPERRKLAALALTRIYHQAAIAPLLQLVADDDVEIRRRVIESLGSYHDTAVVPVLIQAVEDADAGVRLEAVKALGVRSDLEHEYHLTKRFQARLTDSDLQVAMAAVVALSRFSEGSVAEVLKDVALNMALPEPLRLTAVRSLGWMETPLAVEILAVIWAEGSAKLGAAAIAALGAQPPFLVDRAASILLNQLPQLQEQPGHESLLQDLALALGRLGDKRAIPALEKLSQHSHEGVSLHGAAALRQLQV